MEEKKKSGSPDAEAEPKQETGKPGGGAGRRDEVRGSGVYPASGPLPAGDAPYVGQHEWGQGARGARGYEDHGESEIFYAEGAPEKVRDIMTKNPSCCVPTDTVRNAASKMRDLDVGGILVVDNFENKRLVGIVTDRDLALRVAAEGNVPGQALVRDAMTPKPITCSPDDNWTTAIDLMERHQLRRIPVTDNQGRPVGIVAQADVALRIRDTNKIAETVGEISKPKAMRGSDG